MVSTTASKKMKVGSGMVISKKEMFFNFLLSLGPFIGFCIFSLIPFVLSFYMSFTEMHTSDIATAEWIGLVNYKAIFTDNLKVIGYTFLTTIIYTISCPIGIMISIWIARLVVGVKSGGLQKFLRSVFFIPYVCSVSVVVLSFRFVFDESSGILNTLLSGLGFDSVRWMTSSPLLFLLCAIIISVWSGLGYKTVLIMAAMSNVDESIYDAARVDGASESKVFWKITIPAITPTLGFLVTTGIIGSLQVMSSLYVFCRGAYGCPAWGDNVVGCWYSVVYLIYSWMFESPHVNGFGKAASLSWLFGIVIFIITRINLRLQRKWVCYDF